MCSEETDPLLELFQSNNQLQMSSIVETPKVSQFPITPTDEAPKENKTQTKTNPDTFEYGYHITLLNQNETGLMEDFLNEQNMEDKLELSDCFNFGLNEEKWRKLLNKSILMHYERHLIEEQKKKDEEKDKMNLTSNQNPFNIQMMPGNNNYMGPMMNMNPMNNTFMQMRMAMGNNVNINRNFQMPPNMIQNMPQMNPMYNNTFYLQRMQQMGNTMGYTMPNNIINRNEDKK